MSHNGRLSLIFVAVLAVFFAGQWWGAAHAPKVYPAPRTFKLYTMGQVHEFKGQEIRANMTCVEVWLNGRLDTIACPNVIATEAAETTGQPDARPEVN